MKKLTPAACCSVDERLVLWAGDSGPVILLVASVSEYDVEGSHDPQLHTQ